MDPLLVFLALHGGVHFTESYQTDGSSKGYGPRIEAQVGVQPNRRLSLRSHSGTGATVRMGATTG